MTQFHVYRNPRPDSKSRFPFLLDVQTDLIGPLETRVVVPLATIKPAAARTMTILMPVFEIEGRKYVMYTPQLAGVRQTDIGAEVADLGTYRTEIMSALDMLISGF